MSEDSNEPGSEANPCYQTPRLCRLGTIEELTEAKPDGRGKAGKGRDGGRKPRTKFHPKPGKVRKRKWWEKDMPEDDGQKKKGFLR